MFCLVSTINPIPILLCTLLGILLTPNILSALPSTTDTHLLFFRVIAIFLVLSLFAICTTIKLLGLLPLAFFALIFTLPFLYIFLSLIMLTLTLLVWALLYIISLARYLQGCASTASHVLASYLQV